MSRKNRHRNRRKIKPDPRTLSQLPKGKTNDDYNDAPTEKKMNRIPRKLQTIMAFNAKKKQKTKHKNNPNQRKRKKPIKNSSERRKNESNRQFNKRIAREKQEILRRDVKKSTKKYTKTRKFFDKKKLKKQAIQEKKLEENNEKLNRRNEKFETFQFGNHVQEPPRLNTGKRITNKIQKSEDKSHDEIIKDRWLQIRKNRAIEAYQANKKRRILEKKNKKSLIEN
ncbi:hypothetical protein M0812_05624 [Anaeramoeba flamelloides]|uniref:Uncharacterized protein n=1 Tax=Anaeramoeba flamelloides TaxID=1746091 RepID=A0AAV8A5F0_9EUKA|nr:hypothetical protein M0812_05624 [Anaeramoeba flamelloides]